MEAKKKSIHNACNSADSPANVFHCFCAPVDQSVGGCVDGHIELVGQ